MSERTIFIMDADLGKLRNLIAETPRVELQHSEYMENLENELSRAVIAAPNNIPTDVITINSRAALLDLDTKEQMVVTLVCPDEANIHEEKISVLASIGTTMIGYQAGDTFKWTCRTESAG